MPNLLQGKLTVVLGIANKWSLAYAISQAFAREGASQVLTYLGDHQKASLEILGEGLNVVLAAPCDVTKEEDLANLTTALQGLGRPVDAVVHSLAFANREDLSRPFVETQKPGFLLAQEVSSYSLLAVARAVAPVMTNGGSITTMTYIGSTRVVPMYNVMGVAKASLEATMRYLAYDLGATRIRVNAISAGPVKTASARAIKGLGTVLEKVAEHSPFRRPCDPAEVADAAVFLASDLGRGVTGNVVYVDSGMQIMGF